MNALGHLHVLAGLLSGGEVVPDWKARLENHQVVWEQLIAHAHWHMVGPGIHPGLERHDLTDRIPRELLAYFSTLTKLNRKRNERLRQQLAYLGKAINGAGIQPVLLKGANTLLPASSVNLSDRMLTDLDVLVDDRDVPIVCRAMESIGYRGRHARNGRWYQLVDHHLEPMYHDDFPATVEIHVASGMARRWRALAFDSGSLNVGQSEIDGALFRQPTVEWRLKHLLIHTAVQDRHLVGRTFELRQLLDLASMQKVYAGRIDWSAIQSCLVQCGHGSVLPVWLLLSQSLLGQPVPSAIAISNGDLRMTDEIHSVWDDHWFRRYRRALLWSHRLPERMCLLPRKVVTPNWVRLKLREWLSSNP